MDNVVSGNTTTVAAEDLGDGTYAVTLPAIEDTSATRFYGWETTEPDPEDPTKTITHKYRPGKEVVIGADTTFTAAWYPLGDMDKNGEINSRDAFAAYLIETAVIFEDYEELELAEFPEFWSTTDVYGADAGDMDYNGEVNSRDAFAAYLFETAVIFDDYQELIDAEFPKFWE